MYKVSQSELRPLCLVAKQDLRSTNEGCACTVQREGRRREKSEFAPRIPFCPEQD
jgi:hypothetical protein